jgi:membrane protein required for beta-lactamase induction
MNNDGLRHPLPKAEQLWDAWGFAAMEAELALNAWCTAARDLKATAFAAYRSALDREEQAAARLAERVAPNLGLTARAA